MTIQEDDNGFPFITSLDQLKPEYGTKKITSLLQFYKLEGKKSELKLSNLAPIQDVHYLLKNPLEDKWYFKTFRNYECEHLFWYRRTLTFSGDDTAVENLRRYCYDGMLYLCFDKALIDDTTAMLKRLWKAQFKSEGQLDYRIYIELLDQSLRYEDYISYGQSHQGFKTVCNQFNERIRDLWKQAAEKK